MGAANVFISHSIFGGTICLAISVSFILIFALMMRNTLPAGLLEKLYSVSCFLATIVFLSTWLIQDCGRSCSESRGRSFGISATLLKALVIVSGIRLRGAIVLLTGMGFCDLVFIYMCGVLYAAPAHVGTFAFAICGNVAIVVTSVARHHELRLVYTAKNQLVFQMETVQKLAQTYSDALVWVEADLNTLAQRDERLDRWLGFCDGSSEHTSHLSDFMSPEAFAHVQNLLKSPTCASVVMLPAELRHASGSAVQVHLAIVDQRSLFVPGTGTVQGFLVAVSLMDYSCRVNNKQMDGMQERFALTSLPLRDKSCTEVANPQASDVASTSYIPGQVFEGFSIVPSERVSN
eukprot:TRINITY_DN9690_c0_g1_i17.p1 TRINITY_DN9690_c0_g1~~TRINITY_DN9690_c0_g1_i17.p1  ORF type:complete len:377 (-),score=35.69 TRINITY_DN9690_c0_g1_i17:110-1153(-)